MVDDGSVRGGLTRLLGRSSECAVLDGVVTAVRSGQSRALVIRGEAGVGKSALLDYLVGAASGVRVVRAVGVESEMELPFAALQQLCAPMLDQVGRLPGPQREALEIVFGLSGGPAPDRFLVGLAVLSLLSEVADERPLVCVVDDAQWLDQASSLALRFVSRRLGADSVGILFATREPGEDFHGLPELEVQGLRNGDARALLRSAVRFVLDERVRDRIVAETRGNPLALLELPRGLTAAQLAGGFGLLGVQALSGRIEESFLTRLAGLPLETQRFLLVAAAEPVGNPLLVWGAAERLGIQLSATAAAETDGLLAIGERVTFRHPLVRSAVYRAAAVEDRRAAHLALAAVTDREVEPDRRAWHLAAAASGPDEEVALELERSAGRAQARGGLAAAGAFLQRSMELTREPRRRVERALAAAQASLHAGAFDTALGLLATAESTALDELQHARIDHIRAQITFVSGSPRDAPLLLLQAAKRLEPLNVDLARETYLDAWGAAMRAGSLAGGSDVLDVSRAVRATPQAHSPQPSDLLLDSLALLATEGRSAASTALRRAVSSFRGDAVRVGKGLQWSSLAATAAGVLWDFESWRDVVAVQVELSRDAGALAALPLALNAHGMAFIGCGEIAAAAAVIAEFDTVTEATRSRVPPYASMMLAAWRGQEAEARALIDAMIKAATAGGEGLAVQFAHLTSAVLYNGLGRYERALAEARQASEMAPELHVSGWVLPEEVEAAARGGMVELARDALERLTVTTRAAGTDFGLGIEARSRALLSEGYAAERLYQEAVERLGSTRMRPDLARAHLLYGEWLRREGRRVDSRAQLRTAYDIFTTIGMEAFADRTRNELLATGEKVRKRTVDTRDDLTPQEEQIARLARDGLTNPEIGTRLFISPRTVEWHLRKVFTKLGIDSRGRLRDALQNAERPSQGP